MELLNIDSRIETEVNCFETDFTDFEVKFPLNQRKNQLSCLSVNIRSIRKNFNSLKSFLLFVRFKFTFIILTEVWLDDIINKGFDLPGYNSVNQFRNSNGGGIKVFYHESLGIKVLSQFTGIFPTHEALTIKASIPSIGDIFVVGIYRPPNLSINSFNQYLQNNLPYFNNKKCLIAGDLNIDMLKANKRANIANFSEILLAHNFVNFINKPTHIDSFTGIPTSCLDHFWSNALFDNTSFTFKDPFTDHMPCAIVFNEYTNHPVVKLEFRDFSRNNIEKFLTEITNYIDELELSRDDANTAVTQFVEHIKKIVTKHFPIKTKYLSTKRLGMPWLNSKLINCISKKHKLFRLFRFGQINYTVYKNYANCLKLVLRLAEKNYYKAKFVSNKGNSKGTWKYVDKILGRNKSSYPASFIIDDAEVTDDIKIADSFNKYFTEVPYSVQSSLSNPQSEYLNLVDHNENTFFFQPTCPTEVSSVIKKLKNGDNIKDIPVKLLKIAINPFSTIISELFNLCVEQSIFPEILKIARIRPVFKSGSKSSIGNYRPISILPVLDKIFEKLMYSRLYSFFEKYNVISENQFGFRNNKNTLQAALQLEKAILPAFKNNKFGIAIFVDFRKAFDTVERVKFLKKLEIRGIRGNPLELIKSYLSNRKQFTQFRSGQSSLTLNNIGVPQGSCLGPLFFNIYTNDMHNLFPNLTTTMFADDTILSKCGDDLQTLISDLNEELKKLNDWCNFNKLALNTDKTKWILFTNRIAPIHLPLVINDNSIEKVDLFRYLGFNIDSKFSFRQHIKIISSKLAQLSGISYCLRKYLTIEAAKSIYYSFTYSILTYGIALWGGVLLNSRTSSLQTSQNKVVRNLFRPHYTTLSTEDLYKTCDILDVKQIYLFQLGITMFKILRMNDMPFLLQEIHDLLIFHRYPTRTRANLQPPFPRVNAVKYNFLYQAITNWNIIPENIKSSKSLFTFKMKYKKWLISS